EVEQFIRHGLRTEAPKPIIPILLPGIDQVPTKSRLAQYKYIVIEPNRPLDEALERACRRIMILLGDADERGPVIGGVGSGKDIFISYTKPDGPLAMKLAAMLEAEGWSVWLDKSLGAADLYRDEGMKQLAAARAVITI